MNSNSITQWRRGQVAAATAATMFGLCLAAVTMSPVANAIPAPDPPPVGGDPDWEAMAQDCYDGSMRSCDRLADQTAVVDAPIYHDYGFSCGGRVKYDSTDAEDEYGLCVDQYPESP